MVEVDHTKVDDRGPSDLDRIIDELKKENSDLKHDNKSLAKQVEDKVEEVKALKIKLELLDKRPSKWYNDIMKTIIIAFLVLCFTATVGNTNEKTNFNETINNWFVNQKQETIEYQKKNWAEGKAQFARNINTIKSWFIKE